MSGLVAYTEYHGNGCEALNCANDIGITVLIVNIEDLERCLSYM